MYGSEIGIEPAMLMAAPTTTANGTLPWYNCFADSALTPQLQQQQHHAIDFNNLNQPRKRTRGSVANIANYGTLAVPLLPDLCDAIVMDKTKRRCMTSMTGSQPSLSFLGEDISFLTLQQQYEMDRLLSSHMEKMRAEIEQKRISQSRRILEEIQAAVTKRLREKEERIVQSTKPNLALEEKVKQLCLENQIWRELAQANEATANALRTKIEHILSSQ
ncbi:putative BOI-related E3 ubiquitin-protein ligase 3 [Drosera capensis]